MDSITRFAGRKFRRMIKGILVMLAIIIAGCTLINSPPNISLLFIPDPTPLTGSTHQFYVVVTDADSDVVTVSWTVTAGQLSSARGDSVLWTAPLTIQDVTVMAVADDRISDNDTATFTIKVVNGAPIITDFSSSKPYVIMGNQVTLSATAEDPDGEEITFNFATLQLNAGTITPDIPGANTATATWEAPDATASPFSSVYNIILTVSDQLGFFATDTIEVLVYTEYGTIWVVDSGHKTVGKYTSRGDKILNSSVNFEKPVAAASNYDDVYGCYVADFGAGSVIKLDAEGEEMDIFTGLPKVVDIALHEDSKTLWVLTVGDSSLTIFNTFTGEKIKTVAGFSQPHSIEINQNTGDVWIADMSNRIYQLNANASIAGLPDILTSANTTIFSDSLNIPTGMSIKDQLGATLYIADLRDNQIERLTYDFGTGTYSRSTNITGFISPEKVAASVEGLLWVITPNSVQYISESDLGGIPTTIFSYVFQNPRIMVADKATGEMWIGDNGSAQVVKIVTPDSLGARISGFYHIEDIVINKLR